MAREPAEIWLCRLVDPVPKRTRLKGSVANRGSGAEKVCLGRAEGLPSDTEDRVNELTLGDSITLGYPADLPFAD